jgi:hypothetical protein
VTGRELFGQSWAEREGAQSFSFHALIPSGPMAVLMAWATDEVGGVRSARDRGQCRPALWCNNSVYGLFLPLHVS